MKRYHPLYHGAVTLLSLYFKQCRCCCGKGAPGCKSLLPPVSPVSLLPAIVPAVRTPKLRTSAAVTSEREHNLAARCSALAVVSALPMLPLQLVRQSVSQSDSLCNMTPRPLAPSGLVGNASILCHCFPAAKFHFSCPPRTMIFATPAVAPIFATSSIAAIILQGPSLRFANSWSHQNMTSSSSSAAAAMKCGFRNDSHHRIQ